MPARFLFRLVILSMSRFKKKNKENAMLTAGSAPTPPQQRWNIPSGTMWVVVIPKSNNSGSSCQLQVVITSQMV